MLQEIRHFLHPCLCQNGRVIGCGTAIVSPSSQSNSCAYLALKYDNMLTTRIICR
jgi:hypothetical protein